MEIKFEYLKQELEEKRSEIRLLTQTVHELKNKFVSDPYSGLKTTRSERAFLTMPESSRVTQLEKENGQLKAQVSQLKKKNEWFMNIVSEQSSVINNSAFQNTARATNASYVSNENQSMITMSDRMMQSQRVKPLGYSIAGSQSQL